MKVEGKKRGGGRGLRVRKEGWERGGAGEWNWPNGVILNFTFMYNYNAPITKVINRREGQ